MQTLKLYDTQQELPGKEVLAKNIHPASSEAEQKSSAKHVTTQPSTQGMGNYSILRGMSN